MIKFVYLLKLMLLAQSNLNPTDWRQIGFSDEPIYSVAVSPVDKNILFVGVKEKGIFKSTDAGISWNLVFQTKDPVNCLTIDRFDLKKVYAGYPDGILMSTTGGEKFIHVYIEKNINVNSIILDETPTKAIMVGTDKGTYKSLDKGMTFHAGGLQNFSISCLAINNAGPKAVFYASTSTAGIFRSANYGTSWTPVNKGLTSLQIYSVICDRNHPTMLYAGTLDEKIYKSENGGDKWEAIQVNSKTNQGYTFAQAIDNVTNTSIMFMTSFSGDVYSISDNGNTIARLNKLENTLNGTCLGVTNIIPSTLYLGTTSGLYEFEE